MEASPRDNDDPAVDSLDIRIGADLNGTGATTADGIGPDGNGPEDFGPNGIGAGHLASGGESYGELRPTPRLRTWQLAPIVGLGAIGSLMFAFPLAFQFGDGGAVVAMLGVLLSGCAVGWGMMTARWVGLTWPGLPARGSRERPDWRVIALYAIMVAALIALALWRVARLR